MAITLSEQARQDAMNAALRAEAEARPTPAENALQMRLRKEQEAKAGPPCKWTRHSFQFYLGPDHRCTICLRTPDSARLERELADAERYYADLKALLDERAPA